MFLGTRIYLSAGIFLTLLLHSLSCYSQTGKPVTDTDIDRVEKLPLCVTAAPSGYIAHECLIKVDREAPVSPPPFLVPKTTTVYVEVTNTRANETVLFVPATTHTTPPDLLAAAVKGAVSPLQSLVFTFNSKYLAIDGGQDPLDEKEKGIAASLETVQVEVLKAASAVTCLSSYQTIDQTSGKCSPASLITAATFKDQKDLAVKFATKAAKRPLPLAELRNLGDMVSDQQTKCLADVAKLTTEDEKEKKRNACDVQTDRHLSNQNRFTSAAGDIQKAQAALLQNVLTLENLTVTNARVAYEFTSAPLNNTVITISGQEAVNKTNSPIATVTVNCQATHWVISTGILFSNLKFHTFTNAPIIVNGQPVLDAGGKVLTRVTQSDTSPAVVAPVLLVNYRLNKFSRFKWEQRCRNGCSFLLSGGVGANLTSKSADFDTGISFQFGSVLFTPTVHYGRENRLSNGVTVGQELGSSPPNPLPTDFHWIKKFGFAITYALPTP
jgi:hypothetical protein